MFVQLAEHELTWGQAIMRLRSNRTRLRADLIAHSDQVVAEVGQAQHEHLNCRATILSSVIRILP